MRGAITVVLGAAALLSAPAALAQTKPVQTEAAPWWAQTPVIAQTGYVVKEVEANRATFSVSFQVTAKTVEAAQAEAINRTQALTKLLRETGRDAVEVRTTFNMRVLYKQYRNKAGQRFEDQRADRIEAYQVTQVLSITVRDLSVLERAYALSLAASPTSSTPVRFSLKADNDLKSALLTEATADARLRAEGAASALGQSLGAVKLIDPTGRACRADIFGRAPEEAGSEDEMIQVAGARKRSAVDYAAAPPPPPPSPEEALEAKALQNTFLQNPPLLQKTAQACVVFELK